MVLLPKRYAPGRYFAQALVVTAGQGSAVPLVQPAFENHLLIEDGLLWPALAHHSARLNAERGGNVRRAPGLPLDIETKPRALRWMLSQPGLVSIPLVKAGRERTAAFDIEKMRQYRVDPPARY